MGPYSKTGNSLRKAESVGWRGLSRNMENGPKTHLRVFFFAIFLFSWPLFPYFHGEAKIHFSAIFFPNVAGGPKRFSPRRACSHIKGSRAFSCLPRILGVGRQDFPQFFGGFPRVLPNKQGNLVAPHCAIPRDYLSNTPLLRDMWFLVSQHGQLGAIPPPPFLSVSPLGEHAKWRCDTPPLKRGISISQRYLRDAH